LPLLAFLAVALLVVVLGRALVWSCCPRSALRGSPPVLDLLAGLTLLGVLLVVASLVGIAWSPVGLWMAAALAVLAALATLAVQREGWRLWSIGPSGGWRSCWGDAVAVAAVVGFAAASWSLRITTPDFVFHLGRKAQVFALHRGLDWAFLAAPQHWYVHPDYPTLPSSLLALTALLAGRFAEPALMLWSAAFFAALLVAARRALRDTVDPLTGQWVLAALAVIGLVVATRGLLGGAADWWLAVALVAAIPPLVSPAGAGSVRELGLIAGFAAGAKFEGMPLAAVLIAVGLVTGWRGRRPGGRDVAWLGVPTAIVIALWALPVLRHGLLLAQHQPALEGGRLRPVLAAAREVLCTGAWSGVGWILVLLPLLLLSRRVRPVAVVLLAQLGFYGAVYLVAPTDPRFHVLSSLDRLLLHLVPAVLVATVIALGGGSRGGEPRA
jgi:hypothetical protein